MSAREPVDLNTFGIDEVKAFVWVRDQMAMMLNNLHQRGDDGSLYAMQAVRDGLDYLLTPAETVEIVRKRPPFRGLVKQADQPGE